jgi:hypothetical protein
MSKFEIGLSQTELLTIAGAISICDFPYIANKNTLASLTFGTSSSWNIRKVREAVSHLQAKGLPIIAHHGGYSVFGDDPQPVIEYLNREYHRVFEATKKNDQIFRALKQKYGDAVSEKVQQMPGQPVIAFPPIEENNRFHSKVYSLNAEPPFRKSIDARGNEIALDFEYDQ